MRQTHMAWADGQRTTHDGPLDRFVSGYYRTHP